MASRGTTFPRTAPSATLDVIPIALDLRDVVWPRRQRCLERYQRLPHATGRHVGPLTRPLVETPFLKVSETAKGWENHNECVF